MSIISSLVTLDIDNVSAFVDSNTSLHRTRLSWVLGSENISHLLQGLSSSLHEEKVDNDHLNTDPSDVHEVQLPSDLLYADTDTEGVDDHTDIEEQEVQSGSLAILLAFVNEM